MGPAAQVGLMSGRVGASTWRTKNTQQRRISGFLLFMSYAIVCVEGDQTGLENRPSVEELIVRLENATAETTRATALLAEIAKAQASEIYQLEHELLQLQRHTRNASGSGSAVGATLATATANVSNGAPSRHGRRASSSSLPERAPLRYPIGAESVYHGPQRLSRVVNFLTRKEADYLVRWCQ